MKYEYRAESIVDLPQVAEAVLEKIVSAGQPLTATVLILSGDLGAGKTAFTQQIARLLGVNEPVQSPTFTIMKRYQTAHPVFTTLVHIDAYRIEDKTELLPLRLQEELTVAGALLCVEWGERITQHLLAQAWHLTIEHMADDSRLFTLQQS